MGTGPRRRLPRAQPRRRGTMSRRLLRRPPAGGAMLALIQNRAGAAAASHATAHRASDLERNRQLLPHWQPRSHGRHH